MAAKKGNKYAEGNDGGRPTKYDESYPEQAYKLCLLGATDAALADFFNVHVDTINEWKTKHEEFSASVKKGKYAADSVIAQSLFERAKGCTIAVQQAIKLTTKTPDSNGKIGQTEEIEIVDLMQEVPPDTTAAIFWLKNRQPKEWRDKQEIDHTTKGDAMPAPVINVYAGQAPPLAGDESEVEAQA